MVVLDSRRVQVAVEGVLVRRAGMIGNLELGLSLGWIVEEVDIAPSVKSVVLWLRGGIVEVVVDVSKAEVLSTTGSIVGILPPKLTLLPRAIRLDLQALCVSS